MPKAQYRREPYKREPRPRSLVLRVPSLSRKGALGVSSVSEGSMPELFKKKPTVKGARGSTHSHRARMQPTTVPACIRAHLLGSAWLLTVVPGAAEQVRASQRDIGRGVRGAIAHLCTQSG